MYDNQKKRQKKKEMKIILVEKKAQIRAFHQL